MLSPVTRVRFVLGLSVLLLISASPASAEVGVALQLGVQGEVPSLYVVGSIYDDPDPVGHAWRRHVADSDARAFASSGLTPMDCSYHTVAESHSCMASYRFV